MNSYCLHFLSLLAKAVVLSNRIRRIGAPDGVELHIRAKKDWSTLLFFPVWLAGWTVGGIMVMRVLMHPGPSTPRAFFALWLLLWAVAEVWVAYQWAWTAFGKEIVKIGQGMLIIRRDILGYGKTRSVPVGSVTRLR